jgi:hypothetical protein
MRTLPLEELKLHVTDEAKTQDDVEWLFLGQAVMVGKEMTSLDDPVWVAFGGVASREPAPSLLPDLAKETE